MKFAKRILFFLPGVKPARQAAQYAAEAAPVAVSQVGLPHIMLIVLVVFAGLIEGHTAAAIAAGLAAGTELFYLAPKFMPPTGERRMAFGFAGLHVFVCISILAGLA